MSATRRRQSRSKKGSRAPRPRGPKRERTRAALIEAAATVIGQKGLDRTSLEEVASQAGMSRGAIYGNFKNKEELFLAVAATRWHPVMAAVTPEMSLRERMRAHGSAVAKAAIERRPEAAGATSFVQYTLQNEDLRRLVAAANAQIYAGAGEGLSASVAIKHVAGRPEDFVRVVHALTEGLMILHALTPELITPELIERAFELLA